MSAVLKNDLAVLVQNIQTQYMIEIQKATVLKGISLSCKV